MKISSVEFENYKSFKEKSHLRIEDNITTIIGKNEAGKSNLIELLGSLSLTSEFDRTIFQKKNRERQSSENTIELVIELEGDEGTYFGVENKTTKVTFNEKGSPMIEGFLSEFFSSDEFQITITELKETPVLTRGLNSSEISRFKSALNAIESASTKVCYNYSANINTIISLLQKTIGSTDNEKFDNITLRLKGMDEKFKYMYSYLPMFFQYKEKTLKNNYKIDNNFIKEINQKPIELRNFLKASKITPELLQQACMANTAGLKDDLLEEINDLIEENINGPFNEFYKQEEVELRIRIDGTIAYMLVRTSRESIEMSERSNGLKWLINLYLELKANEFERKKILFLIDEPGVYLHVDAQHYLMKLFHDLTEKHQILFTTHSPFMIESDYLENLRPIIKENAKSKVLNSIHSKELNLLSQQETLSPINQSIGISMASQSSIYAAPFSIITEGKLDGKYISAFDPNFKKRFKFISSIGAQNIVNISTILFSWQCDFLVLLDYDVEGRRVKDKLIAKGIPENRIIFISEATIDTEDVEMENLISAEDYDFLGYNYSSLTSNNKTVAAIKFQSIIVSEERKAISLETIRNFERLINTIKERASEINMNYKDEDLA